MYPADDAPEDPPDARPERRELPRPERREVPRPERRTGPAPREPGGAGSLLLGLAAGVAVTFVVVALVEVGTEASPLRHAGIRGKDERQLDAARLDLETKLGAANEQVQAATTKSAATESGWKVELDQLRREKIDLTDDLRQATKEQQNLTKKVEQADATLKERDAKLTTMIRKADDDALVLRAERDVARREITALRAALDKLKEPPRVVVGVPTELRPRETNRRLFAVPASAKGPVEVFGLPVGMKASTDGTRVTVSGMAAFEAVLTVENGFVTVTGTNLGTRPLLGFAVIRVRLGVGEGDAYYHLVGANQQPASEAMSAALMDGVYRYTYDALNKAQDRLRPEYNVWAQNGPIQFGDSARVKVRGEEYILVRKGETTLESRPANATAPVVTLTLDDKKRLYIETKNFPAGRVPDCQIVTAELIRTVTHPDEPGGPRAAVRQELIRIR